MKNLKNSIILEHKLGTLIQVKGCKKYGFIRLLDKESINQDFEIDAFTQLADIDKSGNKRLKEGMLVEYDLIIHSKGYDSRNVRVLEGAH